MDMKKYFYTNGENNFGPYSLEELMDKNISKDTKVWCYGMNDWTMAGETPELNDLLSVAPVNTPNTSDCQPKQEEKTKSKVLLSILGFLSIAIWLAKYILAAWYHNEYLLNSVINILFSFIFIAFAFTVKTKMLRIIAITLAALILILIIISKNSVYNLNIF